jgi:hypothetical protein
VLIARAIISSRDKVCGAPDLLSALLQLASPEPPSDSAVTLVGVVASPPDGLRDGPLLFGRAPTGGCAGVFDGLLFALLPDMPF